MRAQVYADQVGFRTALVLKLHKVQESRSLTADSDTLLIFTLVSVLVFGFMSLKPDIWVSITPFWLRGSDRLAVTDRWLGIITVVGVLVNLALMLTVWKG